MSQYPSGSTPASPVGASGGPAPARVAPDEAGEVARTAADAGRQVAGTAAEQAGTVAQEAMAQARDLVGEARGQLQQQARNGQQKATDAIRTLVRELREMAEGGQQQGTVSEVARQAADRADRLADWLGEREPGDLLEEVRSVARRRPGACLAGAALAGVVVGRLTRGVVDPAGGPSTPPPGGSAAAPRPYAPPVDPYDAARPGDPLAAPTPTGPVGGYAEPQYGTEPRSGTDPLTRRGVGSTGPLDEPYRPEYEGPR